jgi:anti-sigma B factor antagonist
VNFRAERRGEATGGHLTIAFAGELDISSAPNAERALAAAEGERPGVILIDLSDLSFMDSTGLNLIARADGRAREAGRQLRIIRGPESIHRLFRITLLDQRLEFVDQAPDPSS